MTTNGVHDAEPSQASYGLALIRSRRKIATDHCTETSLIGYGGKDTIKDRRDAFCHKHPRTGIAFSGGGIRSATISLGLTEGLATCGRFYAFDMMSTVSGGGYFGTFLRGLFVEREEGLGKDENDIVTSRFAFADAVLTSLPDQQYYRSDGNACDLVKPKLIPSTTHPDTLERVPRAIKNPLWWLRENGRYLAPAGMADYNYALAFIIRNWMTLIFAIFVAMVVMFSLLQFGLWVIACLAHNLDPTWLSSEAKSFLTQAFDAEIEPNAEPALDAKKQSMSWFKSPMLPLSVISILVWLGVGAGYWLGLGLKRNLRKEGISRDVQWKFLIACASAGGLFAYGAMESIRSDPFAKSTQAVLVVCFAAMLISTIISTRLAATSGRMDFPREFRRQHTNLLATVNLGVVIWFAIAMIDTIALNFRHLSNSSDNLPNTAQDLLTAAVGSSAVLSFIAFLIAKLPKWFASQDGKLTSFFVKNVNISALLAGLLMLFTIAALADMIVLKVFWSDVSWKDLENVDWPAFGALFAVSMVFVVIIGRSSQFLYQSGLAPLYSSRLTRTFLGGTNFHRLDSSTETDVTKGMLGDDISLVHYMHQSNPTPAPIHLINVTLNRTTGSNPRLNPKKIEPDKDDPLMPGDRPRGRVVSYESALTLRDRHGDRAVFGPFGARAGAEFFRWETFKEHPSLGLLCATSGAAVNSGMGRHTSLGAAIALTLANVRLGYWWRAPLRNIRSPKLIGLVLTWPFRSYLYLWSELFARFDRDMDYWHLTDGGHSENTGALSLLERGCKFILVADNGQDEKYEFVDLEVFVRSARTDIGMEVEIASPKEFPLELLPARETCFFNGKEGDWRKRLKDKQDKSFALLLRAKNIAEVKNGISLKANHYCWIVWLKPNQLADLPSDIATYAEMNPDFPQQSTSNQFFDEAQWESYRRLGFQMARRLFQNRATLSQSLPIIFQHRGDLTKFQKMKKQREKSPDLL